MYTIKSWQQLPANWFVAAMGDTADRTGCCPLFEIAPLRARAIWCSAAAVARSLRGEMDIRIVVVYIFLGVH
jgi:hypothetical protein